MTIDVNSDADIPVDPTHPTDQTEAPQTGVETADLTEVLEERNTLRDRLLRTTAEFDNYRKRVERERRDTVERAAESVLSELLPVADDLERALAADATSEAAQAYRRGVELIHRQVMDMLTRRGVKVIETVGRDFDPHLHQSVASQASQGHRDGEILEELRRGYMLGDRLLRPAMVKVATA